MYSYKILPGFIILVALYQSFALGSGIRKNLKSKGYHIINPRDPLSSPLDEPQFSKLSKILPDFGLACDQGGAHGYCKRVGFSANFKKEKKEVTLEDSSLDTDHKLLTKNLDVRGTIISAMKEVLRALPVEGRLYIQFVFFDTLTLLTEKKIEELKAEKEERGEIKIDPIRFHQDKFKNDTKHHGDHDFLVFFILNQQNLSRHCSLIGKAQMQKELSNIGLLPVDEAKVLGQIKIPCQTGMGYIIDQRWGDREGNVIVHGAEAFTAEVTTKDDFQWPHRDTLVVRISII